MSKLSKYNPATGFGDFWQEFTKPTPYRWPILGVSALITYSIMYQFLSESVLIPPAPPVVTYIESFAEGRSDAEIIASNIENQKNQDAVAALREQSEERKRDLYRTLGKASGMDVDKIEREAAAERAAATAAEDARKAETRRRAGLPADGSLTEAEARAGSQNTQSAAIANPSE